VGVNHLSNDGFSFVATEDISIGEIIYFTDNQYNSGSNAFTFNGFPTGEAVVKFEVGTSGLNKGVVVFVNETSSNVLSTTCSSGDCGGAVVSTATGNGGFSIATNGEGLYAYSDDDDDVVNGINEVYSVLYTGTGILTVQNGGAIPLSENPLADFPNAIVLEGFPDDGDGYVGLDRVEYLFDPANLRDGVTRSKFKDVANWLSLEPNLELSVVAFTNMNIGEALSVSDQDMEGVILYPNPSNNSFNLKLKSNNSFDAISIHVFDLNGRLISFKNAEANKDYKFGASLPAGLYILNVVQANTSKQIKLIKY